MKISKMAVGMGIVLGLMALSIGRESGWAEEGEGKDFYFTVGSKLWINSWFTFVPAGPVSQTGANVQSFGDRAVAVLPSVSLKYKSFFVSGSYLTTPSYTFPSFTDRFSLDVGATGGGGASDIQFDYSAKRTEADVNLGFYVVPQLGFTVGYKGVRQRYNLTETILNGNLVFGGKDKIFVAPESTTKYDGVTFGMTGAAPIGAGFNIYGNGVGGFMSVKYDPPPANNEKDTATYEAGELGIAWRAPKLVSISVGYKFQIINTNFSRSTNPNFNGLIVNGLDVTKGVILGLNFFF